MKVLQATILACALGAMTTSISAEHLKLKLRSLGKGTGEAKAKTELAKWKAERTATVSYTHLTLPTKA